MRSAATHLLVCLCSANKEAFSGKPRIQAHQQECPAGAQELESVPVSEANRPSLQSLTSDVGSFRRERMGESRNAPIFLSRVSA